MIESEGTEMSPDLNVPEKYNTHDRDTGGFSYFSYVSLRASCNRS